MQPVDYAQFIFALLFVLGLIVLAAYLMRRFGPGGMAPTRLRPDGRRRLSVVESLTLDPRRRILLLRRDDVEHLLLLGPAADQVVETGIAPPEDMLAQGSDPGKPASPSVVRRFDDVVRRLSAARPDSAAATSPKKGDAP